MTKILVIEDELPVRENLVELLEAEDYETYGTENGSIGAIWAYNNYPDLIICDVMMPEIDGYEVLSILQENPVTASIPFIFLTAKADKTDIRSGMNLGADDYLTKPFTRQEVLSAISTRLSKQKIFSEQYEQERQRTQELQQKLMEMQQSLEAKNLILQNLQPERAGESPPPFRGGMNPTRHIYVPSFFSLSFNVTNNRFTRNIASSRNKIAASPHRRHSF